MRIGILGSGLMGGKLGTLFARAGHEVVFSYSRRRKKLEDLARDAGGKARAGRLHAPAGLDLGAEGPGEIALAIVAEVKATLARRGARSLRERRGPIHDREELQAAG